MNSKTTKNPHSNMKVGILTFQSTTNYGACLQCVALTRRIQLFGLDCETINYNCENIEKRELHSSVFASGIINVPKLLIANMSKQIKYRKINTFSKENGRISQRQYNKDTICETNSVYDIFISGSDIIWELNITDHDFTYYLDFVSDNNRKHSYSSSFGFDQIPESDKEKATELLSQYKSISVREIQGAKIIKELLNKDVLVTLDPTLLFASNFWEKLEQQYRFEPRKYVFLYFDDSEHKAMEFAKEIARREGVEVVYLTDNFKRYEGIKKIKNISVGNFLWLIHNALCVVTGSYHGVLFSINYNVPFYYINRAHKSRIETIIDNLSISGRDITTIRGESDDIDWVYVNKKLQELREESDQYLLQMFA